MNNAKDISWACITGYYYPKFLIVIKGLPWDERYLYLRNIYDEMHEEKWEERSDTPIEDMITYVARKDYFHFFCMGFSVEDNGYYIVHQPIRDTMDKYFDMKN